MSGPKCGKWSIESNHERERRIGAELRAGINSASQGIDALCGKWAAAARRYGHEFPALTQQEDTRALDNVDNQTLRRMLEQLRVRLTSLENELAEAESFYRIRDLLAKASLIEKVAGVSDAKPPSGNEESTKTRKEKLSKVLSSLDPGASGDERRGFERFCEEALTKPGVLKFENALLDLQLRIHRFNQNKKKRDRFAAKVDELLDRLTGLEGQEVSRLKQELLLARDGGSKLRSGIDEEVASAAAAAVAEEDRRYASKVLIEELEKLGYSADGGMQTVLVSGGELQINNADLKEYAVCFAVDHQSGEFDLHLTRSSDAADSISGERRLRDRSMEEKWCVDLASALSAAAARGVVARITRREKPGVVPVVVRHGAKRRRSAAAPRARSMRFPAGQ